MKQYEAVVSKTIPALAPDPESLESDPSWSQEQAEAALFQRLTREEELGADRGGGRSGTLPRKPLAESLSRPVKRPGEMCGRSVPPAFCSASLWVFLPIRSAYVGA